MYAAYCPATGVFVMTPPAKAPPATPTAPLRPALLNDNAAYTAARKLHYDQQAKIQAGCDLFEALDAAAARKLFEDQEAQKIQAGYDLVDAAAEVYAAYSSKKHDSKKRSREAAV